MTRFTTALALAGTGAFLVAVALTVADIVLRSVSGLTVHGLTDIVTLCTMAGALLAVPYGFVKGEHVAIDVFVERLPAAARHALAILAAALGASFLGLVAWRAGGQMTTEWGYGDRSQSIGIPMVVYWIPLVGGLAVAALVNLWLVLRLIRGEGREDRP